MLDRTLLSSSFKKTVVVQDSEWFWRCKVLGNLSVLIVNFHYFMANGVVKIFIPGANADSERPTTNHKGQRDQSIGSRLVSVNFFNSFKQEDLSNK